MTAAPALAPRVRGRWHALLVPGLATALATALLVGLGLWQIQRLAWKDDLIATIASRATAVPVPLPAETEWPGLRPGDYAYRRVSLSGTFEHDKEVHVFRTLGEARGPAHGVGYLVLTPLRLASGAHVIVNRGFVPAERVDAATRPGGALAGAVTLTGLMREPEPRNWFTPADAPDRAAWFTRDPGAIAAAFHLDRAAPFSVDADAQDLPGGLPQGGETVLNIPNNHLSYALTWFGLALGLLGVFGAYAFRAPRS